DPGFSADQNLGWRKSRSRRDQVLSVHVSRKRGHVAFVPRDLSGERHVRLRGSGESWKERAVNGKRGMARLCWNFCWACGEGAAISVSYLAAGRLSNCAYWRVDGAHWLAFEDGRLRFRAPVAAVVP